MECLPSTAPSASSGVSPSWRAEGRDITSRSDPPPRRTSPTRSRQRQDRPRRHPGIDGRILAGEFELRTPLVHDVATGAWGSWGNRSKVSVTPAEAWLGRPMATAATPATTMDVAKKLIRRYLAGFGPAGVKDVQAWCGLTRLSEVVAQMRTELRRYSGPDGGELIDLADAELPDPDTPPRYGCCPPSTTPCSATPTGPASSATRTANA
ncbi:crosslink repair DNA glycosylase YcaQ family protein [Streptosporangium roseum]